MTDQSPDQANQATILGHGSELNSEPACSASYMEIFIQVLAEKGIDIGDWLVDADIKPGLLEKFNGYYSYKDLEAFNQACPQFLEVQGFGLAIGEKLNMSTHGSISYVIMSSETYLKGLEIFRRFLKLRTQFIEYTLHSDEKLLTFDFTISEHMSRDFYRFYIECALSGTYTFLKSYLRKTDLEVSLCFDFLEPSYSQVYRDIFGDNIQFDAGKNTLSFDIKLADQVSSMANDSIFSMAEQQCVSQLNELDSDTNLAEKIRSTLLQSPWYLPTQEEMAQQFSMSIRTLRRHLKELDTSYQELLDSVREALAKRYLAETTWSINEISQVLGYSEATNFKRAFKRWSGETPSDFRSSSVEKL